MRLRLQSYYLTCIGLSILSLPAEIKKSSHQLEMGKLVPPEADQVAAAGIGLFIYPGLVMMLHLFLFTSLRNLLSRQSESAAIEIHRGWLRRTSTMIMAAILVAINMNYHWKHHYPFWIHVVYTLVYLAYGIGLAEILTRRRAANKEAGR
ncbi:hypothetical protein [Gorillibacterium sp. sgz5001074]|uniref:hypothetical protein n=1 Tax=Gorillibacterium sp. sgz5001074 TaxID=3446695 RepID=UPI003F672F09